MRDWIAATRPRTLAAAFAPLVLATGWLLAHDQFRVLPVLLATLAALCFQIGCNFVNDVADFERGADQDRAGGDKPQRAVASGRISPQAMWWAAGLMLSLGIAIGGWLAFTVSWIYAPLGVLSAVLAWAYTAGPYPMAYCGTADVVVLVMFGPVAVSGTIFAAGGSLDEVTWCLGFGPGLLAVALLAINNLRDHAEDAMVGKKTLAVRCGPTFVRWQWRIMLFGSAALSVYLATKLDLLAGLGMLALGLPLLKPFVLGPTAAALFGWSLLTALGLVLG
ncbi:MAG TPA: 1,4-dihydroxy-2-naphthoate octaprenyltransferase [Phycisphaerales bacterium]|nr:1,4-dihydroxy-2-naphthoate octaprenyltransferase [Phycisphaerales bacterium]